MAPEGNGHEVSGNGSLATNRGVSSGKEGLSAGRDIHIQPRGVDWALIAIVAIVVVALVVVFVAAIVFWPRKPGEPIPSSSPTDTPIPTVTHTSMRAEVPTTVPTYTPTLTSPCTRTPTNTPTSTSMPTVTPTFTPISTFTPAPTETPCPDLGAAIDLIADVNDFKCNEYKGLPQLSGVERMWCQKSEFEELRRYISQKGVHQAVFFTPQEGPVMGKDNCLLLWRRYDKEINIKEIDGIQVCGVERWAYLPKQTEEYMSLSVHIYMCHLEVDTPFCIRVCNSTPIWLLDMEPSRWEAIYEDKLWPTRVPPTR